VPEAAKADRVSAWAIGIGVGLIALQLTWLVANRLATLIWGVPVGPTIALAAAFVVGITVSVIVGKRLVAKISVRHQLVDQANQPR